MTAIGRFYQTALFGLIWTVDRFRRGLCLRHGAWATFFAGSGGVEGRYATAMRLRNSNRWML